MASSERLTITDPCSLHQSFNIDSWLISNSFSHDTDLLAKALYRSISTSTSTESPPPLFDSSAVVVSNVSFVSDPDIIATGSDVIAKRKRNDGVGVSVSKSTKRRSRVSSKKSQTTFITADAANFRQMVQQVTGAKFIDSSHSVLSPIVKPEPHRLKPLCGGDLETVTTLDTSSFLSNYQQEKNIVSDLGSASSPIVSLNQSSAVTTVNVCGGGGGGGGSTVELDTYLNFPTLDSWKVI